MDEIADMQLGQAHPRRYDALRKGLELAEVGWALEFGVHWGRTLQMIADTRHDRVVGFDSFQGLPEDWIDVWTKGTFAMDYVPQVEGAEIVVGWFEDTVVPWLDEHPGRISFIHMDADLYSSTNTVLTALEDRLTFGTVIVFDEFHNYPEWEKYEAKAWYELVDRKSLSYRMHTFPGAHQVVMEIR